MAFGEEPDPGRAVRSSPMSSRLRFTKGRRWPHRLRLAAAAAVLVTIAVVGVALPTVVLPETQPVPGDSDAVVLLGNGGERFTAAQRVVPRGDADLLVVVGALADRAPVAGHCGTTADGYEVTCLPDVPRDLRERARQVAARAEQQGWQELTVMTATHEVARARMLFERCVGAEVEMVASTPAFGPVGWVRASAGELLALARDGWFQRGC